jgi:hypothetical protein
LRQPGLSRRTENEVFDMAAEPAPFEPVHAPRLVSPPLDERASFLQSLVETMHATLSAEAARVADDIERRRAAFVAAARSQREPMARRMRELANEDRGAIDRWAADELARIQIERERRVHEVEVDLASSLAEHDARIEEEIQRVEAAIATYRVEIEAFFASLARETDPVAIAQKASERPRFPAIEISVHAVVSAPPPAPVPTAPAEQEAPALQEAVAVPELVGAPEPIAAPEPVAVEAVAAAAAVAAEHAAEPERAPVPVMDPIAAKRAEWWAAWKALHEPPELSEVLDAAEQEAPSDVLEAVTAGSVARPDQQSGGVLITSIPILRPFNWLRRGRDADEGAHGTS